MLHFSSTRPLCRHGRGTQLLQAATWISSLIFIILLILYGLYGTAAALAGSFLSKLASHFIRLDRPKEYLASIEAHDACMLVGMHANCSTWYLYTGDRGVVDNLLNKTLIGSQPSSLHPFNNSFDILMLCLRIGHIAHFLSMTFVAAQKGWDGVAMVLLMLTAWFTERFFNHESKIAQQWLDVSGVEMKARRFDFEGRTQMIAAIQILSGSERIGWMDPIIVPHPRREALFEKLGVIMRGWMGGQEKGQGDVDPDEKGGGGSGLNSFDENWVALQAELVARAAEVMLEELGSA